MMFNMIKAAFVVAITLTLTTTQVQAQQTEFDLKRVWELD